jgi:hypothetical protein
MEIYYLIIPIICFCVIETILMKIIFFVREKFQWLIINKDEKPDFNKEGLKKFFEHGYDSELGWIRKPNTTHTEMGENGETFWTTNQKGARTNPSFEGKKAKISCFGDSFTFCRQVNDDETWEYFLSSLTNSNIENFGVGNYGIDQAILRLKREFKKDETENVILAVVPDTISRIVSVWKHYYEYGNTFGFKPRFVLNNSNLKLIDNPINDISKFEDYQKFLPFIRKYDFFYKNKFKREILKFPFSISILKNIKRNFGIIYWILKLRKLINIPKEISWKPMKIIMGINLKWRIKLYKDEKTVFLLEKIIEEYVNLSKRNNFNGYFVFLPQKDDILFIKKNFHFYEEFTNKIIKNYNLKVLDVTNELLKEDNLDELYSDNNEYGGHFSKKGNEKIAQILYKQLMI